MIQSFEALHICEPVLKALTEKGYDTPTPIQATAIPIILSGKDLIASAQTGTGKSAAFCVPILHSLNQHKTTHGYQGIKALILTPTRELATQVNTSFESYGTHTSLNQTAIFGGIPRKVQIDHLSREIDILIATPGRLLDLVEKGYINLNHLSHFVLDEADNMLKLGFLDEVKRVIDMLPAHKQTLLFSATMPYEITQLASTLLHDPQTIKISPENPTVEQISQSLYFVESNLKPNLLIHLLKHGNVESAFIFTKTKKGADDIAAWLCEHNLTAEAIHSERSQFERQQTLERFKQREFNLLVATDVAARGIDVDQVSHVFNVDLPQESDNYVHRIGRTARAGNNGTAITFCTPSELGKLRDIEKLIRQKIRVVEGHPYSNITLLKKLLAAEIELEKKRKAHASQVRKATIGSNRQK